MFSFTYDDCVRASERVAWSLDDVFPEGAELRFDKPFLPPSMVAGEAALDDPYARLTANHVTAHAYLNLFGFVEEYIIAVAVQYAMAEVFGDSAALRALCRFADEELKHQQLFERFARSFRRDFVDECGVIDHAVEVAGTIMSRSPIAVMLATLHLELTTQRHYVSSARQCGGLNESFVSLLHHHWLEEAQHSKIEALQLLDVLDGTPDHLRARAGSDYAAIVADLDGLLQVQARLDADSIRKVVGTRTDTDRLARSQHEGYRDLFIGAGLDNPMQRKLVALACGDESPIARAREAAHAG